MSNYVATRPGKPRQRGSTRCRLLFVAAGLEVVAAEMHVQLLAGGSKQVWVPLTVEQLRPRMVSAWGRRPRRR
jgi:hypothetical protein